MRKRGFAPKKTVVPDIPSLEAQEGTEG